MTPNRNTVSVERVMMVLITVGNFVEVSKGIFHYVHPSANVRLEPSLDGKGFSLISSNAMNSKRG